MKAVLKDGSEIECDSIKKAKEGILLKRERESDSYEEVAGFVPFDELRVISPDDYEPKDRGTKVVRRGGSEESGSGTF